MATKVQKINVQPDKRSGYLAGLVWRFFVRHFARFEGFLDPILLLSHLRRFAQPSELTAPKELLRAGAIMQARGLINSQAIQHNMDWIWPYWVERQFDPHDDSFIPRAFNLTHLNLTHRNWTAVGAPDSNELPIVDPRGLVTPFYDGWSIDHWLLASDGAHLIPSQSKVTQQEYVLTGNPHIKTVTKDEGMIFKSCVEAYAEDDVTICKIQLTASSNAGGWLAVSLRPYNPEGICFIDKIVLLDERKGWKVNGHEYVYFDEAPDQVHFSRYWKGDVFGHLAMPDKEKSVDCDVGMATSAALFELKSNVERTVTLRVPLKKDFNQKPPEKSNSVIPRQWDENLRDLCKLEIPNKHFQFLYDAAIRALILHSPLDVYPGPYTYKRFWFRDAAYILDAMLCVGMTTRSEKVIDRFHLRQTFNGYFLSQDGEWDSNGEALWIMRRFCELTGQKPKQAWQQPIYKASKWIQKKRISKKGSVGYGLLPVGFSAEHLGPNDFYYWDDFWGVAGLRAGAWLADQYGDASFYPPDKRV